MLTGSLTDLAIDDVVRIPAASGKTGELLIATMDRDARLFYVEGKLIHLTLGDTEGRLVLDEVVRWREGEFEFRPDVLTEHATFDGDLERELRLAIEQARELADIEGDTESVDDRVRTALHRFLADTEFAIHACLLHPDDSMDVCGAERMAVPKWMAELRASLLQMVATYPRQKLRRIMLDDDDGTLVVTRLDDNTALLVIAKKGATLGAVTVATEKLARKIGQVRGA
jgi:hypothetical protein